MKIALGLTILLAQILLCLQIGHAQEKTRIGISAVSLGFLPTIVVEKKGFYANYGLTSEHVLLACAIATNALLSEDLDYAVCTGPGVSGAIKGLPNQAGGNDTGQARLLHIGPARGSEADGPSG
jgi:ABC-type nitrate/sulfonate/bicarbonate transport system substrate-binding protein